VGDGVGEGGGFSVLVMVQDEVPTVIKTGLQVDVTPYPAGTGDSVTMQVAPVLKPEIVVVKAVPGVVPAEPVAGDGVPLVHPLTVTSTGVVGPAGE
jgi:hypothetical protein